MGIVERTRGASTYGPSVRPDTFITLYLSKVVFTPQHKRVLSEGRLITFIFLDLPPE